MSAKPKHYIFKIGNEEIEVNDILEAIANKIKEENKEVGLMEWSYFTNAVEYLLRCNFKGQKMLDLEKTVNNIYLMIKELSVRKK